MLRLAHILIAVHDGKNGIHPHADQAMPAAKTEEQIKGGRRSRPWPSSSRTIWVAQAAAGTLWMSTSGGAGGPAPAAAEALQPGCRRRSSSPQASRFQQTWRTLWDQRGSRPRGCSARCRSNGSGDCFTFGGRSGGDRDHVASCDWLSSCGLRRRVERPKNGRCQPDRGRHRGGRSNWSETTRHRYHLHRWALDRHLPEDELWSLGKSVATRSCPYFTKRRWRRAGMEVSLPSARLMVRTVATTAMKPKAPPGPEGRQTVRPDEGFARDPAGDGEDGLHWQLVVGLTASCSRPADHPAKDRASEKR